jgi:hypothetical protein
MEARHVIQPNNEIEAYDIIDTTSDQSHDGDGAKEVICSVYDADGALQICNLLNAQ